MSDSRHLIIDHTENSLTLLSELGRLSRRKHSHPEATAPTPWTTESVLAAASKYLQRTYGNKKLGGARQILSDDPVIGAVRTRLRQGVADGISIAALSLHPVLNALLVEVYLEVGTAIPEEVLLPLIALLDSFPLCELSTPLAAMVKNLGRRESVFVSSYGGLSPTARELIAGITPLPASTHPAELALYAVAALKAGDNLRDLRQSQVHLLHYCRDSQREAEAKWKSSGNAFFGLTASYLAIVSCVLSGESFRTATRASKAPFHLLIQDAAFSTIAACLNDDAFPIRAVKGFRPSSAVSVDPSISGAFAYFEYASIGLPAEQGLRLLRAGVAPGSSVLLACCGARCSDDDLRGLCQAWLSPPGGGDSAVLLLQVRSSDPVRHLAAVGRRAKIIRQLIRLDGPARILAAVETALQSTGDNSRQLFVRTATVVEIILAVEAGLGGRPLAPTYHPSLLTLIRELASGDQIANEGITSLFWRAVAAWQTSLSRNELSRILEGALRSPKLLRRAPLATVLSLLRNFLDTCGEAQDLPVLLSNGCVFERAFWGDLWDAPEHRAFRQSLSVKLAPLLPNEQREVCARADGLRPNTAAGIDRIRQALDLKERGVDQVDSLALLRKLISDDLARLSATPFAHIDDMSHVEVISGGDAFCAAAACLARLRRDIENAEANTVHYLLGQIAAGSVDALITLEEGLVGGSRPSCGVEEYERFRQQLHALGMEYVESQLGATLPKERIDLERHALPPVVDSAALWTVMFRGIMIDGDTKHKAILEPLLVR